MKTITSAEIDPIMQAAGVCTLGTLLDNVYALPDLEWLKTDFAAALDIFQNALHINQWKDTVNDCDDFGADAAFFARLLHRRTVANRAVSICFGTFDYCVGGDETQGHCINFSITEVGGKVCPVFFEPQTRFVVTLSPTEIASCSSFQV